MHQSSHDDDTQNGYAENSATPGADTANRRRMPTQSGRNRRAPTTITNVNLDDSPVTAGVLARPL
jgi:hypothetical protein